MYTQLNLMNMNCTHKMYYIKEFLRQKNTMGFWNSLVAFKILHEYTVPFCDFISKGGIFFVVTEYRPTCVQLR